MSNPQPVIALHGDHLAFGPMRRDLIPLYHAWINDLSTMRFLRMSPTSLDEEIVWYDQMVKDNTDRAIHFTIYELPDYRPVGNCNLHHINRQHRSAELGIMIGEHDARGRGLGTEAVRLICDYGFNALGLNNIMLRTVGWNIAGQKAYTKAGFQEIGRRRQALWFDGRYWDDIYYDLLRDEFESPVVRDILTDGIVE